ncbi:MAG TPA: TonB-dependent receptor [Novosphingobium sp.]|nr:TonB-dependent receptor [Novosphingobium sp.]
MKIVKGQLRVAGGALALALMWGQAAHAAQAQQAGGPAPAPTATPASAPGADATDSAPPAGSTDADSDKPTNADIIVTGSNISGVKPVGSETIAIDRNQILSTGLTNTNDLLQTLPQVQSNPNSGGSGPVYRQGGTAGYGGNSTQGTAINLRGLGTSATLTLVDGRRVVPSGAAATFTEAIQVPLAALERVEVVSDGNSAIYGSDAISGVINYVLRKKYDGVEVSGRDTFDRYHNTWGVSMVGGHSWSSGNIIITYDHEFRQAMNAGKSRFLRGDLRSFGLPDLRTNNATVQAAGPTMVVGNSSTGYSYYSIPAGSGAGTTFSSLTSGANTLDASDYNDYLGRQTRDQAAVFINQDVTPSLSLFVESFYTKRNTQSQSYNNSTIGNNVTVCEGSPYYITGAPSGAAATSSYCGGGNAQTVAVNALTFFNGRTVTSNPSETISVTGGFANRMAHNWKIEGYVTYAHDSTCGICNYGNNPNMAALAAQITAGNINPYSSTPLTSAQYATFMGSNTQWSYNTFWDGVLKANGPVFSLPGGDLRTAAGVEFAYNRQHLINASNTNDNNDPTDNAYLVNNDTAVHRSTISGFAEVFVPVVGPDMHVPFVRAFNIDAAFRYDRYSDFGSTTNPKIGATWDVTSGLSIRGSWGTSFRAPALTDTNPLNFSAGLTGIPWLNNSGRSDIGTLFPGYSSAYEIIGANQHLTPETASTWSLGFDFKPVGTGLKFSATYYNTHYSNQIIGQNTALFLSNATNAALYSNYVIPVHNPSTCVAGNTSTYDPVLANFLASNPVLYKATVFNACTVNVIIDGRSANAASTFQDGLDFQLNYMTDSRVGRWNFALNVTKILNQTVQTVAGGATVDVLGTYYYPVSLRGRGQIGWSRNGLAANLFVNYVGSYTNTIPVTGSSPSKVPSWTTVDLGLNYTVPAQSSLLKGVRLAVNIQNLFDLDPPVVLTQTSTSYGTFDPSNANIYGRIISLQVTKAF